MGKILTINYDSNLSGNVFPTDNTIVLIGGCFDILHIGHLKFIEEAKKYGDFLIVLLESDAKVRRLKGINRPIFNQKERAVMLSSLTLVDLVISLPDMKSDADYEELIERIKPEIIVITENDPMEEKKRNQADKFKSKFVVIPYIKTYSTSKLAKIIGID